MTYHEILVIMDICNRPTREDREYFRDLIYDSDRLNYRQMAKLLKIIGF